MTSSWSVKTSIKSCHGTQVKWQNLRHVVNNVLDLFEIKSKKTAGSSGW